MSYSSIVSNLSNFERRAGAKRDPELMRVALRTAFVSRFIVLREGRRSRAHREIEQMSWSDEATADDLYKLFREAFQKNGDKLQPVDRDLKRAMEHAKRSVDFFIEQYTERSTLSFEQALEDYERSNALLFGDDDEDAPRKGGWRLPSDKG
ncbi:MAG: hypothetical protein KDD66_07750 [Bdellovibrionales bacterium]|nr:hypothetical protein [Bdellovibrionales bacterium]